MDNKNIFEVFMWPEVKYFFQFENFIDNAVPITDKPLLDEYGGSAWLIRKSWIDELKQGKIEFTYE